MTAGATDVRSQGWIGHSQSLPSPCRAARNVGVWAQSRRLDNGLLICVAFRGSGDGIFIRPGRAECSTDEEAGFHMPKRNKKQLAAARALLNAPADAGAEYELAQMRLALAKEMLAEYEAGTHGFANRVEMTAKLIELTRADIARFEATIARHESSKSLPNT